MTFDPFQLSMLFRSVPALQQFALNRSYEYPNFSKFKWFILYPQLLLSKCLIYIYIIYIAAIVQQFILLHDLPLIHTHALTHQCDHQEPFVVQCLVRGHFNMTVYFTSVLRLPIWLQSNRLWCISKTICIITMLSYCSKDGMEQGRLLLWRICRTCQVCLHFHSSLQGRNGLQHSSNKAQQEEWINKLY